MSEYESVFNNMNYGMYLDIPIDYEDIESTLEENFRYGISVDKKIIILMINLDM